MTILRTATRSLMLALIGSAIVATLVVLMSGGEERIGGPLLAVGSILAIGLAVAAYAGRGTATRSTWVIFGVGLASAFIILLIAYAFLVPW